MTDEHQGNGRPPGARATAAVAVLLAATSGAADVVAFFGLGRAFASVITGNLITAGYGIATGDSALVKPAVIAVAGYLVGGITWSSLLRRTAATTAPLVIELALFVLVLAGWLASGSRPSGVVALALLAVASAALGGQSAWALRIHQATTYFTGTLTQAAEALVSRDLTSAGAGARQLCAVLAGAIASGATLYNLRPAAPAVPVITLAAAIAIHLRTTPRTGPQAWSEPGSSRASPPASPGRP